MVRYNFTVYFSHDRTETNPSICNNHPKLFSTTEFFASKTMATIGSITLGDMFDVHHSGGPVFRPQVHMAQHTRASTPGTITGGGGWNNPSYQIGVYTWWCHAWKVSLPRPQLKGAVSWDRDSFAKNRRQLEAVFSYRDEGLMFVKCKHKIRQQKNT